MIFYQDQATDGNNVVLTGVAHCSPTTPSFAWTAIMAHGLSAATINDSIKGAAVDAAIVAGFTVGALDKKILLGGALTL